MTPTNDGLEKPPPKHAAATVAICTYQRASDVKRCIAALADQAEALNLPVIIVDSGSSVSVAAELRSTAVQYNVKYLRSEEPGLSKARNLAAANTSTEWLAFLDDDAVPDATWATFLLQALAEVGAKVAIVGGLIRARYPDGWSGAHITDRWKLLLSCTDASGSGPVPERFNICGANLAVRLSALKEAGAFPEALGRVGNRLLSGEETFLIERLRTLGYSAWYDDRFGVDHLISTDRLKPAWAAKRAFWEGFSRVRIIELLGQPILSDMRPMKLLASIPVLTVLSLISADYRIRLGMALGSLRAQTTRT